MIHWMIFINDNYYVTHLQSIGKKKQFDVYDIFVTATYSLIINQGSIYHT